MFVVAFIVCFLMLWVYFVHCCFAILVQMLQTINANYDYQATATAVHHTV